MSLIQPSKFQSAKAHIARGAPHLMTPCSVNKPCKFSSTKPPITAVPPTGETPQVDAPELSPALRCQQALRQEKMKMFERYGDPIPLPELPNSSSLSARKEFKPPARKSLGIGRHASLPLLPLRDIQQIETSKLSVSCESSQLESLVDTEQKTEDNEAVQESVITSTVEMPKRKRKRKGCAETPEAKRRSCPPQTDSS